MPQKLFHGSNLSDAPVWALLTHIDEAEAMSCPHCGGEPHSATYPCKPHGLARELRDDARRFSCAG